MLAVIAKAHNLRLTWMSSSIPMVITDAGNKSLAFAMENHIIRERSLFLLATNCPEHQRKGISLHDCVEMNELESYKVTKKALIANVKAKLAAIPSQSRLPLQSDTRNWQSLKRTIAKTLESPVSDMELTHHSYICRLDQTYLILPGIVISESPRIVGRVLLEEGSCINHLWDG
jgi:hypothetical protein